LLGIGVIAALVIGWQVTAFATLPGSGFEGNDGNLVHNSATDWNDFEPATWTGTAPNRTSSATIAGWDFDGLEDAQATTSDNGFAGGTKQDATCPTVISAKAPNKDDLKRAYFASKTAANGDIFLELAWVRITQNTTSPSAHVAFEFNQSQTLCSPNTGWLVTRTAGNMLIVYDFEGGATDTPTLNLSRWITSGGPCEVTSNSPPCWSDAQPLGAAVAEARVNTSVVGSVSDAIHPTAPPAQTLGVNEFGEAGINLTDAGVFTADQCTSFGKAYAVSRTSGSSSTAQMKDLVGPGNVDINNCGGVTIRKVTVPSPDPTDTTFTYDTTGGLEANDPGFSLKNGESKDFGTQVQAGSYSVTEDDPSADNFALTDINCDASSTTNGTNITIDETARSVSFDLEALDSVDCTFTNTLQTGAIKIHKDRKHAADGAGNHPHAGVDFTIEDSNGDPVTGSPATTDANGDACVDGLTNGTYTVHENTPAGYATNQDQDILVDNTATCEETPYGGETANFHNTPLTNVSVSVDSQVDGGTASTMQCTDSEGNVSNRSTGANGDGSLSVNDLEPTAPDATLTCVVTIDP
jgi:hypothetical protein